MDFLIKNGDEDYEKRIIDVAEKLHKIADKLRKEGEHDIIITWEDFTDNYMKAGPYNDNLQERLWKEKRSNMWKDDINDKLCELGYPEWLFNEPRKGIKLRLDVNAVRKMQIAAIKKTCSINNRKKELLEKFAESFSSGLKKQILAMASQLDNQITYLAGQITLDPKLPKRTKKELLGEIERFIPKDKLEE